MHQNGNIAGIAPAHFSATPNLLTISEEEKRKKGDLHDVNEIWREGIHKVGKTKTPSEIIADFTGEEFRSHYYIDYLIEKFSKIYGIQNWYLFSRWTWRKMEELIW